MTDTARSNGPARRAMAPWLAALLGGVALVAILGLIDLVTPDPTAEAQGGWAALGLLIGAAAGAFIAVRLSRRALAGWLVGAVGLLLGVLVVRGLGLFGGDLPLWLIASILGSPLLGARLGVGGPR